MPADASRRTTSDFVLFAVTSAELALLFVLTPTFGVADWVYVLQHGVVLALALTRPPPRAQDRSLASTVAVLITYAYPYAQVAFLRYVAGEPAWPNGGLVLLTLAAFLSFVSLLRLGPCFGVRPALRGLATGGPYALVRHPLYLAYLVSDIGYNLREWNYGTMAMVLAGWLALVYRIRAEERILALDARWPAYTASVRYRVVPGVW